VKKLAAIIFSFALVAAQVFAVANIAPAAVMAKKSCCACGAKCCAGKTSSSPEKIPAVPAPTSTLKNLPAISGQTIVSLSLNDPTAFAPAGSASLFVSIRTVPFFTRDCAFLI